MMRFLVGSAGACLLLASGIENGVSASSSANGVFSEFQDSVIETLTEGATHEVEGGESIDGGEAAKELADLNASAEFFEEESPVDFAEPLPRLRGRKRMFIGLSLFLLAVLIHYLDSISVSCLDDDDALTLPEIGERLVLFGDEINDKISESFDVEVDIHIWIFFSTLLLFADGAQKFAADLATRKDFIKGTQLAPVEGILPLSVGLGGLLASKMVSALEPAQNFGIPFVLMGSILLIKSLLQRRRQYKKAVAAATLAAHPQAAAMEAYVADVH